MKKTVIIAHENPIMRSGFSSLLKQFIEFESVECATAESVLVACKVKIPTLILTSFTIPNMGALQLTTRLKALSKKLRIIVCAAESSGYIAEKSIRNGAHGYITSSIAIPEFFHAIESVCNHDTYTEPYVSQKLALKKISGQQHVLDVLSPREFDIFSKVILDKTAKEVAQDLFLAEKTVSNYISIIKKKLHTKTSAGLLKVSLEEGYINTLNI
ncbi:MAG: DNA-binding NarL/FixJ family response regulator [Pseudohongiellaceae bacterium]|jgi:DNA-binding NarL/FixJ family response regulator